MIRIKTAILDDDRNDCNQVLDYFQHVSNESISYECSLFQKPDSLFYSGYDLYIVDIEMPDDNGFDVAKRIKENNEHAIIIMNSKRNDCVFESFRYGVFYFTRKDHFIEDMEFAKVRLTQYFKNAKKSYLFQSNQMIKEVPFNQILYIEKYLHTIQIHLIHGKNLTEQKSIKQILPLFDASTIIPCHQSYLVNLEFVKKIENNDFIMKNGEKVQISKRYYQKVKEKYIQYLTNKVTS